MPEENTLFEPPWKEGVQQECEELSIKITNLRNFIVSKRFSELSYEHRSLLNIQLQSMQGYYEILQLRLGLDD